ncbi:MAG: hypothetical protein V8R40_06805 [Dysosmobacter sp.]
MTDIVKDSFSSFVLRDLIALLSGLMLMLLHGTVEQGILTALVPQSAAPWELAICAAAGRLSRAHIPISRVLPSLVLAPLGMIIRGALWRLDMGGARRSHLDGGTGGGTGLWSGWPAAFICLDGLGSGTGGGICAPGPSAVFVAAVPAAGAGCIRFVSGGLTVYFLT